MILTTLALAAATFGTPSPVRAASTQAEYIVQFNGAQGAAERRAAVERAGGEVTRDVGLINGAGAVLSRSEAAALRRSPEVKAVTFNARVKSTALSFDPKQMATAFNQAAKTVEVWKNSTGKGVGVAVVDTGVAGDLVDFRRSATDSTSRVVASAVVNPNATTAGDSYGHGTLVAGILAGNSGYRPSSDALRGKYAGAAPDADIISVKIADEQGNATVLDAIYGVQFAVDHKAAYNIRVINLSVSSTEPSSYRTDPLDAAVEAAWFKGIVVVAAAGNDGNVKGAVDYAPGNDPYIITVGAVDDGSTKNIGDDVVTSWSSRGTTMDGYAKPDVYAPGAHMVANLAPNSAFRSMCPTCIQNTNYIQAGGTSLAAPMVAGAVADILAIRPTLTPNQIKSALTNNTRLTNGSRVMDALDASLASTGELQGANVGLVPNQLINPSTGAIDYTRASWRMADWTSATDLTQASWSRASWRCDCSTTSTGTIDPARASWRRASWRNTEWTK
jgi:serine protease AprX